MGGDISIWALFSLDASANLRIQLIGGYCRPPDEPMAGRNQLALYMGRLVLRGKWYPRDAARALCAAPDSKPVTKWYQSRTQVCPFGGNRGPSDGQL